MASSQCCDNPPALNPACGKGKVVDSFGGLKAYVAGPEDSKAAVVLVADVFGTSSFLLPLEIVRLWYGTLQVKKPSFSSCRIRSADSEVSLLVTEFPPDPVFFVIIIVFFCKRPCIQRSVESLGLMEMTRWIFRGMSYHQ
jgi:hypothetical protein